MGRCRFGFWQMKAAPFGISSRNEAGLKLDFSDKYCIKPRLAVAMWHTGQLVCHSEKISQTKPNTIDDNSFPGKAHNLSASAATVYCILLLIRIR